MSRAFTDTRLDRLFTKAGDVLERHERTGLGRDFGKYRDDPVGFARDVLHAQLWNKQIAIADAVLREPQVSVRGGVGVGKDFTCAVLALWWCYCRNGLVLITSATARQVREILFQKEIRRLFHAGRLPGELLQGAVRPASGEGGIIGFTSSDVDRLTGFHDAAVLGILSEAQGLDEDSFIAMKSCAVSANDRLLAVGNPTRPLGPFFASQRPGSPWTKVSISVFEHPNVVERRQVIAGGPEYAWLERIRAEEGEGSQFWSGRILAEFPTESSEALFTRALLDAAVARPVTPNGGAAPDVILGLDVARFGSDSTACAILRGDVMLPLETWHGLDTMGSVARVQQIALQLGLVGDGLNRHDKLTVVVDVTGGGAGPGVADRLRELGYNVVDFHSSNPPPPGGEYGALRPLNARAGAFLEFRHRLRTGTLTLPDDPMLLEECAAVTIETDQKDRAQIGSKIALRAQLGRSPDRCDAVMLAVGGTGGVTAGAALGNFGF